jgi:methionine sulfoxide reductase heme-binding subunit
MTPVNDQILWFASRGAGIVSLLLFSAVTCLGILTVMRWQSASWPRFLTVELHRNLALLSVIFLVLHIATAILDPFVELGWLSTAVPFVSDYRPLWVGLGTLSVDLLLAVLVTSLLRARVGQRAWRAVHWLAYGAWPLAVVHGIGTGSDISAWWMRAIDVACVVAVGGAVTWRVTAGRSNRSRLAGAVVGNGTAPGGPR